jgi:mono/diheme cytochrome c family protein
MASVGKVVKGGAFALAMVPFIWQTGRGQEIINRQEQARGMVLTTPQSIYRHYCAHCHGENAMGGGRLWASELSPTPANLTTLGVSEDYLIAAIRDGSTAHGKSNLCPPWGRTISPANIERLARYIASLGGKKPTDSNPSVSSMLTATPEAVREPFPWLLSIVLLAEIGLLGWILRAKALSGQRSTVTPKEGEPLDPAESGKLRAES